MAYPYYQNYPFQGYNQQPVYSPVQPVQQVQQARPTEQQPIIASGVIPVSSKKQVDDYPMAPNAAVVFISTTENVMYLKQADAVGRPTTQIYKRDEEPKEEVAPKVEYAPMAALESVANAVSAIKGEIETMRGDLYGIAGKKKAVKKQEGDVDE